jgi:adenylate cyclase
LVEQAIARDPHYGAALGRAAVCCMHLASANSAPDREANRQKGIDFARRALQVAGNEPGVLADTAYVLACFGEDINAMTALVDRALAFNPSYASGWHISGFLRLWAGETDLAIEHAERALRLSPRAQARSTSFLIGAALFFSRRFDEAGPRLRARSRKCRFSRPPIVFWRLATRIWGCSTRRAQRSRGCARSPQT